METDLLIYLGIASILFLGCLAVWIKLKKLFRGFRKQKTESDLRRLRNKSGLVRGLFSIYSWWQKVRSHHGNSAGFVNACRSGDLNQVKKLIEDGIDVNARRHKGGRTGLMFAAQKNHIAIVELLLNNGCDVNASGGGSGKTALIRASENGNYEIVKDLLEHGAIVDIQSKASGKTALMKASEGGFLEVAEHLVRSGATVDKRDKSGRSALFLALNPFNKMACDVVDLLVRAGANVGITDDAGNTALERAREFGLKECEQILIKHGAESGRHYKTSISETPGEKEKEAYSILGCTVSDSDDQVKSHFREMIKKYHPDTISGKNLHEDFITFANKRFVELHEAYKTIMDSRNKSHSE